MVTTRSDQREQPAAPLTAAGAAAQIQWVATFQPLMHQTLTLLAFLALPWPCMGQAPPHGPDTIAVHSATTTLGALVWRPPGTGPFPAILFNHGSGRPKAEPAPGDLAGQCPRVPA